MFTRNDTKKIAVGNIFVGGGSPVSVQSMTNTPTADARATVAQIRALCAAGCDIVRVAVPDAAAAAALPEIVASSPVPVVADVHFDYRLALAAVDAGVAKIRINPGNIGSPERVRTVAASARAHGVPIRVGVNSGSLEKDILEKYGRPCGEALAESALRQVAMLEAMDFGDICVSVKSSNVIETVTACRTIAGKCAYPQHVGLTEAGTVRRGTIKSGLALGILLSEGIGDTIRVSLTGDPVEEVKAGCEILTALGLGGKRRVEFVSCPTCGRTKIDLIGLAGAIESRLDEAEREGKITRHVKVAVMGCAVNGPGEASDADIGLAGGDGFALLFRKGKISGRLSGSNDEMADLFVSEVLSLCAGGDAG